MTGGDWRTIDKGCAWLDQQQSSDGPFFLYVGMNIPHPPFHTSDYWLKKVDLDQVTIPPEDKQLHPTMEYQRISKNWRHGFDDDMVRKVRSIYYAMCSEGDAMVGQVMEKVAQLGLDENTYFIFSSDHGENCMEHRQWYKMNCYESSARVPLVIRGPGIQPGTRIPNVVSLIDIYPTLMDMGNVSSPAGLDGESLMPLLIGQANKSRNWAFTTFTGTTSNTSMFMLRKGDWKYIAYPGYPPQLFNLKMDPDEIDNVAPRQPDVAARMDRELRQIVDYDEVHQRRLHYDRTSFRQWEKEVAEGKHSTREYGWSRPGPADTYDEIIRNTYMGWSDEHERQFRTWLNAGT